MKNEPSWVLTTAARIARTVASVAKRLTVAVRTKRIGLIQFCALVGLCGSLCAAAGWWGAVLAFLAVGSATVPFDLREGASRVKDDR